MIDKESQVLQENKINANTDLVASMSKLKLEKQTSKITDQATAATSDSHRSTEQIQQTDENFAISSEVCWLRTKNDVYKKY